MVLATEPEVLNIHDLLQQTGNISGPAGPVSQTRGQSVAALVGAATSSSPVFSDRLQLHSHLKALLKPAVKDESVDYALEHKTFALAINRDYFSTVFTSDHPCTI